MCQSVQKNECFFFTFGSILLCLFLSWIVDSGVVDGFQFLYQYRLGILDVAEGDGTFAKITVSHLSVDETFRVNGFGPG